MPPGIALDPKSCTKCDTRPFHLSSSAALRFISVFGNGSTLVLASSPKATSLLLSVSAAKDMNWVKLSSSDALALVVGLDSEQQRIWWWTRVLLTGSWRRLVC